MSSAPDRPAILPPPTIHARRADSRAMSLAQLRGRNLVPFTFDKQVLLLETMYAIWRCVYQSETLHSCINQAENRCADMAVVPGSGLSCCC